MKCKHCNSEIADDSIFCEFCGKSVGDLYERNVLDILNVASYGSEPLVALKARNKCHRLSKNKHPNTYREDVKKLMVEQFPMVFEKCKIDLKYIKRYLTLLILCMTSFCVAFSVHWEAFDVFRCQIGNTPTFIYQNCCDIPPIDYAYTIIFVVCSIIVVCALILIILRKSWYNNQLQKNNLNSDKK